MCGICGIVNLSDKSLLKKMTGVLEHRGPDDQGFYIDDNISLGNRRLSIIDLAGGHQPISNEDGSIWITFNGEIYNFQELRKELEGKHRFSTNSDTEVIVHLYEELGEKCVEELRGMFAFAIWDGRKKLLLLARDRLGKKPLYYAEVGDKFLFASEIKSILQFPEIKREVETQALDYYLTLRYVPGPLTLFKGIKKLMPGHIAIYSKGKLQAKKYWDVKFSPLDKSDEYFFKKFWDLFKESVRMRLISDVPLGVYLSGGLDSNAVLAAMTEINKEIGNGKKIETFTVGFDDPNYGELEYGRLSSEYFDTNPHEVKLSSDSTKILPEIVWHYDEPVTNVGSIPAYFLSEAAKKHVTVVLTGEGGDELLAGYTQYKKIKRFEKFSMPSAIKKFVANIPETNRRFSRYMKFLSAAGELDKNFIFFVGDFDNQDKKKILSQDFLNQMPSRETINQLIKSYLDQQNADTISRVLYLDIKMSLPDDMLMKLDKMTMANSIESRAPLLDHVFVEFCATIPTRLKLNGDVSKFILRKTLAGKVPQEIIDKRKTGLTIPKVGWLDEMKEIIPHIISEETLRKRGYFNDKILKVAENYNKNSPKVWSLIMLELWHRMFIDSEKPQAVSDINKLL